MKIRLDDRQKEFLELFLDYHFRRKKTKLSRKIIKKEMKLHDQTVKRLLDYFIGLDYIKRKDREYWMNPKKKEDIKDTLEYNEKEDKKLYSFIPFLSSLIIIILIISLIGVIFYYINYVYEIEASPNITSIIPKTSPFKTATITTNLPCGEINESLECNIVCYGSDCRYIEDINISEDWNISK